MWQPKPLPVSCIKDTPRRAELITVFVDQIEWPETPEACWDWTGYRQETGHGRVHVNMASSIFGLSTHRLTYAWWYGVDPHPLVLDHLCARPPCVNPLHLDPVTQHVNILRGEAPSAHNARKFYCDSGHPLYGDNLRVVDGRRRACRACDADKAKRWRESVDYGFYGPETRTFRRHGPEKKHCINGHEWAEKNIRVRKDGSRECRECFLEHKRDWSRRRRALEREAKLSDPNREPTLAERIADLLTDGPLAVHEMAERLPDVKKSAVAMAVQRMLERGEIQEAGTVPMDWGKGVRKVKSYTVG